MPVEAFQTSIGHQAPVALFEFTYGEGVGDVYRVTNHDKDVSHGGNTFTPTPISAEAISNELREQSAPLEINMKRQPPLADLFGIEPMRRVCLVKIYEGHVFTAGSPHAQDFALTYSGRVLFCSPQASGYMKLACDTLGAGMKRPMLRMSYSRECQHRLYGSRCQANKAAATIALSVNFVTGRVVDFVQDWYLPWVPGNFLGGTIEWTGTYGSEVRRIIDADGERITLDGTPTGLTGGSSVNVVLGCPLTSDACLTLHNNIINYSGCKYIPKKNPFGKNNHT